MNKNIGELIKQRRTENKMTLKDISEATELSIGYLSQLERGLTSIAHDTLKKVAKALGVEMTYFMEQPKTKEKAVLRSYEREILRIEGSSIIEYAMTNMADRGEMLPKLVEILPQKEVEESLPYHNTGSSKYEKLGRVYPAADLGVPSQEHMEMLKSLFEEHGFQQVKIGG